MYNLGKTIIAMNIVNVVFFCLTQILFESSDFICLFCLLNWPL